MLSATILLSALKVNLFPKDLSDCDKPIVWQKALSDRKRYLNLVSFWQFPHLILMILSYRNRSQTGQTIPVSISTRIP